MKEEVIYIGLDVDDRNFHGAALIAEIAEIAEVIDFKCRPNTKGLIDFFHNLAFHSRL